MALVNKTKKELASVCPGAKLQRQLGQGGNGTVYAAAHAVHGKVAIKFFLNTEVRRRVRFNDEVKVVTERLKRSPRVLPILEFNLPDQATGGVPWYIMPTAEKIQTALASADWRGMLPAFIELADGLAELHQLGVAHRDVKPENMFRFAGSYRFGDFGIAAFPERTGITRMDEPMGPATFMAPEMESNTSTADPYLADVYSLAKSFWALLAGEKFAFPGQYVPGGKEGLVLRDGAKELFLDPLDALLVDATSSRPEVRPTAAQFSSSLKEVAALQYDFNKRNPLQWEFANSAALKGQGVTRAEWTAVADIVEVVNLLSRHHGMNHCFYPEFGGSHISGASVHEGGRMLMLHIPEGGQDYLVRPIKLILERFPDHPELGYAVLQVGNVDRLTQGSRFLDGPTEQLRWLNDYDYVVDDSDDDEPRYHGVGHACSRRFKEGLFVIAPTRGVYNDIDDYMGTAQRLGVEGLREQFESELRAAVDKPAGRSLVPVVRLQTEPLKRVPFSLEHLTTDILWQLLDLDDALLKQREESSGGGLEYDKDIAKRIRETAADPLRAKVHELLNAFTDAQRGEYLALTEIAQGIATPEELFNRATSHGKSKLETHYLSGKVGTGYVRKALAKFGLKVA